jgi:hypothetical protein
MSLSFSRLLSVSLKPVVALLLIVVAPNVFAQGVYISKRANLNPNPGTNHYSDVVADGHYAYVSSWQGTSGVYIFDIANPDSPVFLTHWAPSGTSNMQGIQVLNGIGYFASDGGSGIYIVDLSNPAVPKILSHITTTQGLASNSVHDLTLDGNGHMFVPNYRINDDVQVWDVSNPAAPKLMTTLTGTDSVTVHDVTVQGNRLYMAGWGSTTTPGIVDIWDISALPSATLLGSFPSGLHTQDISVTVDGRFLACPRELSTNGDVGIFDITDPTNVVRVATITEPAWGISATSPSTSKIMGNLLYVAWYQAGLLVFDITDPTNPIMVGSYDTWPGVSTGGTGGGNGDWGVWPFQGQDRVLVSDRTTGLYVLDATGVSSQPAPYVMTLNPTTVLGSKPTTGTAYMVGVAPSSGATINLTSDNAAVTTVPLSLAPGTHSIVFNQPTSSVVNKTVATLTATDGTHSAPATLTLNPPQPASVTIPGVRGGLQTTGKVILNAPAAEDTSVSLAIVSGGSAVAWMQSSVTVPTGATSATWPIQTVQLSSSVKVTVSATLNGLARSGAFVVSAITPSALSFSPTTVTGGTNTTGKVTFPAVLTQDTVVTLAVTAGSSAVAAIPSTVTVSAGTASATFPVTTNHVSATTTVTVSASANGAVRSANFTVK